MVLEALVDLPNQGIVGRHNIERDAFEFGTRSSHMVRKMLGDDGHLILIAADELSTRRDLEDSRRTTSGIRPRASPSAPERTSKRCNGCSVLSPRQ